MTADQLDLSGLPAEIADALRELAGQLRERFAGPSTPYDAQDHADAVRRLRAANPFPPHPARSKTPEQRIADRRAFIARHAVHGLNLDLSREAISS